MIDLEKNNHCGGRFAYGQGRVSNTRANAETPPCPTHSQKWLTPYLASGLRSLKKGHS